MRNNRRLYPYQREAAKWLFRREKAALFAGVGTGKTGVMLHIIWRNIMECAVRKVLVVAPIAVCKNTWISEYEKWTHHIPGLTFARVYGSKSKRLKALQEDADIYLVNYETVNWLLSLKNLPQFDMLVLDESTRIKSHSSVRFAGKPRRKDKKTKVWLPPITGLKAVVGRFEYIYLMTGTPKPGEYLGLWSQIYMLDKGKALERNITSFKVSHYYKYGPEHYHITLRDGHDKKIQRAIRHLCYRIPDDEVAKYLPKVVERDYFVALPDRARKTYISVEEEFFAYFEESDEEVTVVNTAVRSGKLRQVAQGAIYTDTKSVKRLHDEKVEMLDAIVEELDRNVLVIYQFKSDLARLLQWSKGPVLRSTLADRTYNQIVADWNAGKTEMLYGHALSMGHGLNLQGGAYDIIFYGALWSLELYQQTVGRLRRTGQENSTVFVHRIVAADTIETGLMLPRLRKRAESQRSFLRSFNTWRTKCLE